MTGNSRRKEYLILRAFPLSGVGRHLWHMEKGSELPKEIWEVDPGLIHLFPNKSQLFCSMSASQIILDSCLGQDPIPDIESSPCQPGEPWNAGEDWDGHNPGAGMQSFPSWVI